MVFLTQVSYVSDYEISALALQYRSFKHPRSLKCEGAVPLRKSCLFFIYFCTIWLFFRSPTLKDSYWSTISGTNSPRAGPAAAMVDVLWSKKRHIVQKTKGPNRQDFRRGTAPSHFKLRGWLMDLFFLLREVRYFLAMGAVQVPTARVFRLMVWEISLSLFFCFMSATWSRARFFMLIK